MLIGLLRGGGAVGQFLDQKGEKGLQRERIGGRRVVGQIQEGQIRIRMERVFRGRGLFEGVRRRRWRG